MERIIFKNIDNTVGVIIPTPEALESYTINDIAMKDCPQGLPYWIVETSSIPSDRTTRGAWEADEVLLGEPTGYGSESNVFEEVAID